jgi:hypothetical protein
VYAAAKLHGADPAAAIAVILSTGLSVRKSGKAPKPPLSAKHGAVSGQVLLAALAVAHTAMYYWEISVDSTSWASLPETLQSRTTVTGLTPGQV